MSRGSFATGFGALASFCGLFAMVTPVVLMEGRSSTAQSKAWAWQYGPELMVGGALSLVVGYVVGHRYGRMERYYDDYNEETGRIEGHPVGRIINPLLREDAETSQGGQHSGPDRRLVAAAVVGVHLLVFAVFSRVAPDELFWPSAVVLAASAVASSLVVDRLTRSRSTE